MEGQKGLPEEMASNKEPHIMCPECFKGSVKFNFITNDGSCGFPVYPYLLDSDGKVVATPEEIGLFDPGETSVNLIDFDVKEMNFIMREFDGLLEVFVDEDEYEQGVIYPVLDEGKVILKFLDDNEEEPDPYWEDTI